MKLLTNRKYQREKRHENVPSINKRIYEKKIIECTGVFYLPCVCHVTHRNSVFGDFGDMTNLFMIIDK